MMVEAVQSKKPRFILTRSLAIFGIIWNAYGAYQFIGSLSKTRESLMAVGMNGTPMTAAQADVYMSLPVWVDVAFALGAFGGLLGSVLLLMRHKACLSVLGASLLGYIVLFVGDYSYGVFAQTPDQLVILSIVVAIAFVLFITAFMARQKHYLSRD